MLAAGLTELGVLRTILSRTCPGQQICLRRIIMRKWHRLSAKSELCGGRIRLCGFCATPLFGQWDLFSAPLVDTLSSGCVPRGSSNGSLWDADYGCRPRPTRCSIGKTLARKGRSSLRFRPWSVSVGSGSGRGGDFRGPAKIHGISSGPRKSPLRPKRETEHRPTPSLELAFSGPNPAASFGPAMDDPHTRHPVEIYPEDAPNCAEDPRSSPDIRT